jgi:hypothetical protein
MPEESEEVISIMMERRDGSPRTRLFKKYFLMITVWAVSFSYLKAGEQFCFQGG